MSKTFALGIVFLLGLVAAERDLASRDIPPTMSKAMLSGMAEKKRQWAEGSARRLPSSVLLQTEGPATCVGGMAGAYPCKNIDLLGHMPLSELGGGDGTDIWGWTSPEGREIAIAQTSTGTAFVDIATFKLLGVLPSHGNVESSWHDVKVFKNYAFLVSEAGGHGLQIFDMTTLGTEDPGVPLLETVHYGDFGSSHNLVINEETGFAYVVGAQKCRGGLYIININEPESPVFEGCFADDGYTHDAQCVVYHGPDARYQGREICFNYNEDTLTIVDVTDKTGLTQLSRTSYVGAKYTHQGWLTEGMNYLLMDDELDKAARTATYLWDLRDLKHPIHFDTYSAGSAAIAHNLYTKGQYAYCSNYNAGLRVLNMSTIDQLGANSINEAAYFDLHPETDSMTFSGVWSSYIYFSSGKVVSQSIPGGLYILQPNLPDLPSPSPPPANECAPGCPMSYKGDGYCSEACNVAVCDFDGGDCEGTCSPTCPASWHDNDQCELGCNTTACGYDNGFCVEPCAPGCEAGFVQDGSCQSACNNAACGFDSATGDAMTGDCAPTCDDGVQNMGETQRDCGGANCPDCGDHCPFLGVTDHTDMLGCYDGTQCNRTDLGWGCCVADHGGRAVCPPTHTYMCAQDNLCGGGQDFCCSPSVAGCADAGGIMLCRADTHPFPTPPPPPYYMGAKGGDCPLGEHIASLEECKMALSEAMPLVSVAEDMWWSGNYQRMPQGCSYRAPNGKLSQAHFNTFRHGDAHADRTPVCKTNKSVYTVGAMGTECATPASTITDQIECEAAMETLGLDAAPMWTGAYSLIPAGCSYRANGPTHGHFNSHVRHAGHKERAPICKA